MSNTRKKEKERKRKKKKERKKEKEKRKKKPFGIERGKGKEAEGVVGCAIEGEAACTGGSTITFPVFSSILLKIE